MAQLKSSVVYEPDPDATPKAELNVLANVYRFIFDCHAKRKAAGPAPESDSRNDAKESDGCIAYPNHNR